MILNPDRKFVISDANWNSPAVQQPIIAGEAKRFGYRGMWAPDCQRPKTFADLQAELGVPLLPETEWRDRVRYGNTNGVSPVQFARDMGLPCKDQNQTNYCWINAPAYCADEIRLRETGQIIKHSPASAGARIKNFRNVGGWGSQGLEFMREHGINLTEDWPDNAINRSYLTDANVAKAKHNVVLEYYKLTPGRSGWAEVVSCVLAGIPVAVGYNWWSHEVTLVWLTETLEAVIRNSWGIRWGDDGYGEIEGSRKYPDDAVAITAMQPYSVAA